MQACIFWTSNPRGQTTFFAWYVLSGNSLFLGRRFFFLPTTLKMRCQSHRSLPSIAANPVWYLAFCGHLRKLGTTMFCDPLTSAPASPSPFQFHILPLHQ